MENGRTRLSAAVETRKGGLGGATGVRCTKGRNVWRRQQKQRTTELRLQAPRPNNLYRVKGSGLRGGRESIISVIRSDLTSSKPPGNRPDSVSSIARRGDDYGGTEEEEEEEEKGHGGSEEGSVDRKDRTDETVSGETDDEEEDHVDS